MKYGEDQLGLPFPLAWWDQYAGFGTRQMCRKQLTLANSVGALVALTVLDALERSIAREEEQAIVVGFTEHGAPVVRQWGLPTLADGLDDRIPSALAHAHPEHRDLHEWFRTNASHARDLAIWHVVLYAALPLLERCVLVTTSIESDGYTIAEGRARGFAMAVADTVMFTRCNGVSPLSLGLFHILGPARQDVPGPPWRV